jgi:hypothetical protein
VRIGKRLNPLTFGKSHFVELFSWNSETDASDFKERTTRTIQNDLIKTYKAIFERNGYEVTGA